MIINYLRDMTFFEKTFCVFKIQYDFSCSKFLIMCYPFNLPFKYRIICRNLSFQNAQITIFFLRYYHMLIEIIDTFNDANVYSVEHIN